MAYSARIQGSISDSERAMLGIGDNLARLSVGVKDVDALVADVEQARLLCNLDSLSGRTSSMVVFLASTV